MWVLPRGRTKHPHLQRSGEVVPGDQGNCSHQYVPIGTPQSELVTLSQQCKGDQVDWGQRGQEGSWWERDRAAFPPFPILPVL